MRFLLSQVRLDFMGRVSPVEKKVYILSPYFSIALNKSLWVISRILNFSTTDLHNYDGCFCHIIDVIQM